MRERCIQANHFTDNFFNTTQLQLSSIKGVTRNRFNTGQIQWNNSTLISLN